MGKDTIHLHDNQGIVHDVILNMNESQAYCDSKGLFAARKAVMQYTRTISIPNVEIEDIYMGNGVSELIVMAMQALLDEGGEVLIPMPDYPLWTAAVSLCTVIPPLCDRHHSACPGKR